VQRGLRRARGGRCGSDLFMMPVTYATALSPEVSTMSHSASCSRAVAGHLPLRDLLPRPGKRAGVGVASWVLHLRIRAGRTCHAQTEFVYELVAATDRAQRAARFGGDHLDAIGFAI